MTLNPVAYTEKVVSGFLRYQLTTFPFADRDLHEQMRRLLSLEETRRTPLLKGPYVSLSRAFREGAAIDQLAGEGLLHPHMVRVVAYPRLYGHQELALRAICGGRTTVVSTGTGSGKTECFLYPVISHCLKERDAGAPAGIRAVFVYPMNALAEDQLGRMRELLAGSGVTFGMYVGRTPQQKSDVTGQRLRAQSSQADYRSALARARAERRGTAVHPPEERCSREEMRTTGQQPRILLTNVKQLELLLTRGADVELFQGADLRFIVFDEAHTFTGAMGAETACLIRRLRAFCGRKTRDTVCVATSATLADPRGGEGEGREFATRFFGVDEDAVTVVREEYAPDLWSSVRKTPPAPGGSSVDHLKAVLEAVEASEDGGALVAAAVQSLSGETLSGPDWRLALYQSLAANELVFQLATILTCPCLLSDVVTRLGEAVGREVSAEEVLAWLALGAASRHDGRPLLRPVVHAFVRGIGGAVVTFPADQERPRLWLSAPGELDSGDGGGLATLPVTSCTTCGQHYFVQHLADFSSTQGSLCGGEALEGGGKLWKPLDSKLGGRRAILVDRLISNSDEEEEIPARLLEVQLCRYCGALHSREMPRCASCGRDGSLLGLMVLEDSDKAPGFLNRCLTCEAPGRARGADYREPARPVRAVTVSDVFVLAQEMIRHADRRRLLIFADNRQDAAFQAGWMRDHARRYRVRALMTERIEQGPVSVGDLTAYLDEILERDDDLSEALAPEVWNVHRKEAEGLKHAEERRRYLRIQVLRELATGVKQRVGLEPWGRIQVRYSGLGPDAAFVQTWAPRLRTTPELLADGIAAILDRLRRGLHLLDREGQVFSRYWMEGDLLIARGFLPQMPGVPKGLKLEREEGDDSARVTQLLAARGDTSLRQALRGWGLAKEEIGPFAAELWRFLTEEIKILASVTLTGSKGRPLPGCAGVFQIDADRLLIRANRGLWRCQKCRRSQVRASPHDRCLAWRCDGTLQFEAESPDNYDLALLDGRFAMIRPREHSAQVPDRDREYLENMFKGEGEAVNTLVCTPTLELGVDIGALDAILMRNTPPLPANYWQRAGRAGRRHRMAVNVTYSRPVSHDQAYFRDPLKILDGRVESPRFNLRNDLMVTKHVHAALLTRLHQLARPEGGLSEADREVVVTVLATMFPRQIKDWLFDEQGHVRVEPFSFTPLRDLLTRHEADLASSVTKAFSQGWPAADRYLVAEAVLLETVRATVDQLAEVLTRLRRRLQWALDQNRRLDEVRQRKGALDTDEEYLRDRCERLIKRLKGIDRRRRTEGEGHDETSTYSVLAAEGFLPGYGLDVGSVVATALPPHHLRGLADFDLPRPPAVAVREYVPGNLIYANGHKYVAKYFQPDPLVPPVRLRVDPATRSVAEASVGSGGTEAETMAAGDLLIIPICDLTLVHVSHITDEEENRFQLPVALFGSEQDRHAGGQAWQWGERDLLLRRSVNFRLVNVGAASLLERQDRLGYPVCLVCGQSRSPFASQAERDKFHADHRDRCGRPIVPVGFYADVVADALSWPGCADWDEAYSLAESLRLGAAQVLDMDRDDLEVLVVGRAGAGDVTAYLYDPMPGGSGLLDQICARFEEVWKATHELVSTCTGACDRACVDCLLTFRNAFYHRHLNRRVAAALLETLGPQLVRAHEIPSKLPTSGPRGDERSVNDYEERLRNLLQRAGMPEPQWKRQIELGRPLGSTTPDAYFDLDGPDEPGLCLYLDGLSTHIHGNPVTQAQDRRIREQLRALGYHVLELAASELYDRGAMVRFMSRVARLLLGPQMAQLVRDKGGWYEAES